MPGEGITHLIFFIGAIVIAVAVIGVLTSNMQSITASYGTGSKTLAEQLRTDITIINDPEKIPYDASSGNYSFFVKNTGKSTLDTATVNLFIDGNYVNITGKMTIMEGGDFWYPSNVLRMNYSGSLSSGDHTVRVVAGNGVFDTMPFRK